MTSETGANSAWTITLDSDNIAWLTFDLFGEKVNKLTATALAELESILDEQVGGAVRAVVIRSAKKNSFVVGADINELAGITDLDDAAAKADLGKRIFEKLAALPVPTLAVIHGTCLGGGLELALACRYRLVTDHSSTSLGVPEVNLGIIPGWGGTLRIPRVVGLPQGLKLILTGRPVDGRRAARIGLADAITGEPFVEEQARRFIENVLTRQGQREVARRRRRCRGWSARFVTSTSVGQWLVLRQARRQVLARTRGHYPAPLSALDVVARTYRRAGETAAAIETEAFARLAVTPISRNLVWLFQAGQRLKKAHCAGDGTRPVTRAAVVGAGIMGSGIAWSLARNEVNVRLKDVSWPALGKGMAAAASAFGALVRRRRMTESEMTLAMHRIGPTVDDTGFGDVDVVIEAVAENMQVKKTVLAAIEKVVGPDTLICTNTSSLSLKELSGALERPERFVGLHFFNPVPKMPLVEVVAGPQTTKQTVVAAAELVKRMGKTPMIVGDCAGFLVNRILLPYLIESAWMFEEGIELRRIDTLLEGFGMPIGPLALVDEVGLDVGYTVAKVLEEAYGQRMQVPGALGSVVRTGEFLGRKTGAGFYRYRNGRKKPNRRVERLAREARREDGISARELTDEQIVDRAILIMVNEAARCLEEGVIAEPETLDMAMVMGTGFAPFRGGLLKYADERGVVEIRDRLGELARQFGDRFKAAPLIDKIAATRGSFYTNKAA
ncbi:MAG: enoyl-CoA hydratase/isomerase family protein [Planctomycetes bacterium]|nr:enoyl-CoA hydratase/isomerase family protein [Planctomycetota bacterium]